MTLDATPVSGPDERPKGAADVGPDTAGSPAVTRAGGASAVLSGWSALDDTERRRRLDAMEPDAVRCMAASMPVIEQAKGVLMGCFGLDAEAAFALLRRVSSERNLKLRAVAAGVVDAVSATPGAARTAVVPPGERVRRALGDSCAQPPRAVPGALSGTARPRP